MFAGDSDLHEKVADNMESVENPDSILKDMWAPESEENLVRAMEYILVCFVIVFVTPFLFFVSYNNFHK